MQKHIKVFRDFYEIGDQDPPKLCFVCGHNQSVIHHIHRRGLKGFEYNGKHYGIDEILNLIPLCVFHHLGAHGGQFTKDELLNINEKRILLWSKSK